MKNEILMSNNQEKVEVDKEMEELVIKACNTVLENEGIEDACEISVTFVDNAQIKEINSEFRHKEMATDVLSFPLGEDGMYDEDPENGALMLGDIVISLERALEQSEMYGHSVEREVAFLTTHSMLHLLGYDHVNGGEEERIMRSKEEEVLVKMGLPRTVTDM